jgi:hypothetical protein
MSNAVMRAPAALPPAPLATAREVQHALEELRSNCNVLTPSIVVTHIPPMYKVSIGAVAFEDADVYGHPGGFRPNFLEGNERAPSKIGLLKILQAAGWQVVSSTRLDDRKSPLIAEVQVVIEGMQLDGNMVRVPGTKRIDLTDGSPQAVTMKDGQLKQQRAVVAEQAETKALLRAIRAAFGIKQKYTTDELKRPFVIPRLVADLDASDPEIRKLLAAKALGLTVSLFGDGGRALPEPPAPRMLSELPDDDDDAREAGAQGPAGTTPTAGASASNSSTPAVTREQQRHLFALAGELGFPSDVKVQRPSGQRTAIHVNDPAVVRVLGLTEPFIIVKEHTEQSIVPVIQALQGIVDARKQGPPPEDGPPPPVDKDPVHICGCPCGCQAEISEAQAESTLNSVGAKRCPSCYPGRRFDVGKHAGIGSLNLPSRQDITAEKAAQWAGKAVA